MEKKTIIRMSRGFPVVRQLISLHGVTSDPLNQYRCMKIDEKPHHNTSKFQITKDLRFINRMHPKDSFEFHNHRIFLDKSGFRSKLIAVSLYFSWRLGSLL